MTKLFELERGQRFTCEPLEWAAEDFSKSGVSRSGKFIKMDGMYGQVLLDGLDEILFLSGVFPVEVINDTTQEI